MTKAPATLNALKMADPLGNPKRPIRRRVFVAGSVALLAAPWVADGQERNPPRIGALLLTSNPENFQRQFGEALQELGYAQGRNIAIEYRSAAAGEVDRLAELAGELVRLRSDIIVAQNTPAAQAAKRATADIPIVIMAGDPVGTGLFASIARPRENAGRECHRGLCHSRRTRRKASPTVTRTPPHCEPIRDPGTHYRPVRPTVR